jgi:glycosyltransferase involved in cell wall biosynthesis
MASDAQTKAMEAFIVAAQRQEVRSAAQFEQRPPQVSVICTAKNAAATIGRTLESVLAQDLRDWEMIVVDDGSTDATLDIVHEYARADPRIRPVITGGLGRIPALNRALAEARADLVANIDADDEAHPHLLGSQLDAMRRHPEFAVIATGWFRIYGAQRPIWAKIDDTTRFEPAEMTKALAIHNGICHSAVIMRRAAILALGGYDDRLACGEDYDLWVRCAVAGLRLGRIRLPLVAQRIHAHQRFQHGQRLRTLLASLQCQSRAIWALGRKRYLPLLAANFLWSILPLSLRCRMRDLGTSWRGRPTASK